MIPKAKIFKNSEVFKHLNEDAIKTDFELRSDEECLTRFLQKPRITFKIENQEISNKSDSFTEDMAEEIEINDAELPELMNCANEFKVFSNFESAGNIEEERELKSSKEHENSHVHESTIFEKDLKCSEDKNDIVTQCRYIQKQLHELSILPSTIQTLIVEINNQLNQIFEVFNITSSSDVKDLPGKTSVMEINHNELCMNFDNESGPENMEEFGKNDFNIDVKNDSFENVTVKEPINSLMCSKIYNAELPEGIEGIAEDKNPPTDVSINSNVNFDLDQSKFIELETAQVNKFLYLNYWLI